MPHQCTDCGRVFADGSTEMLSGCPDCGGTTFQFHAEEPPDEPEPAEPPEPAAPDGSIAGTVGNAATTVRDLVGGEDAAQASARSDVVSPSELAVSAADVESETDLDDAASVDDTQEAAADERPGLAELRAELNEQFESIKVVEPGQYELNLMELYDREEYIIALQEDGRYSIQVPDRWRED
ncbi:MAG: Zn-ribbon containing protein [Salinirussus sp.]